MICTDSKLSEKASTVANAIKDKAQENSKELELKDTCHIQTDTGKIYNFVILQHKSNYIIQKCTESTRCRIIEISSTVFGLGDMERFTESTYKGWFSETEWI